ncbi:MAG: 3-isopropylmalate dehydratase large subunit [Betaproteobacteria bacterium]|nr:3-isopropylmalate dehydratase large subunit [Betaproteobacteria bacterium]
MGLSLYEKIWARHAIAKGAGERSLLYVDRHLMHDGSFHAFSALEASGRRLRRPDACFATPDHYIPTRNRAAGIAGIADATVRGRVEGLESNARKHGVMLFGFDDPRQGIVHVVGPEQGVTQPGMVLVCGDSHTSTHGAFGAMGFGIGASEVAHVMATQTLWARKAKTLRVTVDGALTKGVSAKDVILAIIAKIGTAGGNGHAIEYAGSAIRSLSMAGRMTVCNMSIEAGARCGMVAPDDTSCEYLSGRAFAPKGTDWDKALAFWRTLPSDADAKFDREATIDGSALVPQVTWGTSPEYGGAVTDVVPDPERESDVVRRESMLRALAYMDLAPGTPLAGLPMQRVFIGSCTNSRIEDLRAAAQVLRGRKVSIPTMIVPGSGLIKQAAESEGLHRVFAEAGAEWLGAACSMCVGTNGDLASAGERVASTSNRNFEGRQGQGVRTHLMSPAMAAAAAVRGAICDVRTMLD